MTRITILGSTGTIGINTLSVIDSNPELFSIEALTAHSNVEGLFAQCQKYNPRYAVMVDANAAALLAKRLRDGGCSTEVYSGTQALIDIAGDPHSGVIVAAIVGAAGLLPTLAAVHAGKRILLANKESLVMAGSLFMEAAHRSKAQILPIDSEHNAILQCLPEHYLPGDVLPGAVESVVLTASGGPFRLTSLAELESVTPEQAVAHPNWRMGAKISVDSATMMNKGLEVIEAYWLFNIPIEKIKVLIHPQSVIHAFVHYCDGSTLAQLSDPDMRIPIARVLGWPARIHSGRLPFDVLSYQGLHFEVACLERYPCLKLAYAALQAGGTAPSILNAANEVAVQAFLRRQIGFRQIHTIVAEILDHFPITPLTDIAMVQTLDQQVRELTQGLLSQGCVPQGCVASAP